MMPSAFANRIADSRICASAACCHARVNQSVAIVERIAATVAGCALLSMMVLVSLNALTRYFFNAPLSFQFHVTQFYLLVSTTMLALPWGYRKGGAIQIRLLLDNIPSPLANLTMRLGLLASAVYLFALAWQGYHQFHIALVENEVVMGVIDWPVAWSWVWIPIGCGLLAVRLLVDATAPTLRPISQSHD